MNTELRTIWHKYRIIWIIAIVSVLVLGARSFFQNYAEQKYLEEMRNMPTLTPTKAQPITGKNGIVSETNLYYGELNGESLIKIDYRSYVDDVIFNSISKPSSMSAVVYRDHYVESSNIVPDDRTIAWSEVVHHEIEEKLPEYTLFVKDDLITFKKIPNTNILLLAVMWGKDYGGKDTTYYDPTTGTVMYAFDIKSKKLTVVGTFKKPKYDMAFPIIASISPDKAYVELNLYYCFHCEGHTPSTILLNINTLQLKNIGHLSYFRWLTNGSYEYKKYAYYDCVTPVMGGCPVPVDIIPLLYDNFDNADYERSPSRTTIFSIPDSSFSLEYPNDWSIIKEPNVAFYSTNYKTSTSGISGGSITIFVEVYNNDKPLMQWFSNKDTDYMVYDKREIKLVGAQGIQYFVQSPQTKAGALIASNNKLLRFEVTYGENDKKTVLEVFNQMLKSIRVTN